MLNEVQDYLNACCEQQVVEERVWKAVDPRSPMNLEGRTIKSQLEDMEHMRQGERKTSGEMYQREAIAQWGALMRTLSAEWSSWFVQVS